jgi:hypothetical protein
MLVLDFLIPRDIIPSFHHPLASLYLIIDFLFFSHPSLAFYVRCILFPYDTTLFPP